MALVSVVDKQVICPVYKRLEDIVNTTNEQNQKLNYQISFDSVNYPLVHYCGKRL